MISVYKNFDNPPADLKGQQPQITTAVKQELYDLYHGKCAFSEEKLSFDEMAVIDFLPLDTFGEILKKPEMRWANLLPVSPYIKERFDRINFRYSPIGKSINNIEDYYQLLKIVNPKILHPEVDSPENHLYFSDTNSVIQSISPKGIETIAVIGLNEDIIITKRSEKLDFFLFELNSKYNQLKEFELFLNHHNRQRYQEMGIWPILDLMKEATLSKNEFSLLGYHIYYNFHKTIQLFFRKHWDDSWPEQLQLEQFERFGDMISDAIDLHDEKPCLIKLKNGQPTEISGLEENYETLPIALKGFVIKRFFNIKHLEVDLLPINAQWIFFTGENGFGKTLILQAIVSAIHSIYNDKIIDINTTATVELFRYTYAKKNSFAAYGPIRTQLKPNEGVVKQPQKTDSIFGRNVIMQHDVEEQLCKLHGRDGHFKEQFDLIIKTLGEVLPHIKIDIDDTEVDKKVIYREENEQGELLQPIGFTALSAGTRSIVALIGDMLIELMQHQPDVKDSKDLAGIVIIDEIDAHLHPKWQRELVIKLSQIFPKVQFIASTHSPIPLLGAPRETVILNVERESKEKGITVRRLDTLIDITKLTPNTILSSPIFGFGNILPEYRDKTQTLYTDDTYDEVLFKKMLQEKLAELLGGDIEELKKLLTPEKP